jgi:DNA-binding MarR family transcriptional regulator
MAPFPESGRPTQKEKTLRAFRTYFDLLDAADYLRVWLRSQMAMFGLSLLGLRVLEMLYREGPMEVRAIAARRGYPMQHMHALMCRMEAKGWVSRKIVRRAPAPVKITRIPKARRGKVEGRKVTVVALTQGGQKFIGMVIPTHAKAVKALMRALDGREQDTLSHLLRKLTEGDILKFIKEMTHVYEGEDGWRRVVASDRLASLV